MALTFYYNDIKIQIFKIFSGTLDEIVMIHAHTKNSYEIHLIDDGKGILDAENNRYDLSKNTLFVTGPNVLHKQTPDFNNPMHELCIYLKISNVKDDNSVFQFFTNRPFWIGKSNAIIRQIFKQIIAEDGANGLWKESILSSLVIRLITEMARLYYPNSTSLLLPSQNFDLNENRSWILDELLSEDCSNVTLSDFAKGLGVSTRQAERIIKDHYGSSFKKLRYESKMAMAAMLLEQKDISVEECSVRCGYSSVSAFSSAFKQKFNTTPKTYKRLYKIKK